VIKHTERETLMRQGIGIVAALAGALALGITATATAAPGDAVYKGATAEGVSVKLTVGGPGNATKFKVGKTKVQCDEGGRLTNQPGTYSGFDTSDPGAFKDKRTTESDSGRYHFRTKSSLSGTVAASGDAWSGKLKLSTKVFKNARRVDTCRLKTTWDAS
jgi:hypothetical protein